MGKMCLFIVELVKLGLGEGHLLEEKVKGLGGAIFLGLSKNVFHCAEVAVGRRRPVS